MWRNHSNCQKHETIDHWNIFLGLLSLLQQHSADLKEVYKKSFIKLLLIFIDLTFNESEIFHDFTFSKFFFPTRFWTFKGDCVVVYQWTFIPFSPCLSCLRPDCNWMVQSFHFHKNLFFVNFQRNKDESRRSGLTQINQILRISRPSRPCLTSERKKTKLSQQNTIIRVSVSHVCADKEFVLINFN